MKICCVPFVGNADLRLHLSTDVLGYSGCPNKIPWTKWLKQHLLHSIEGWGSKVKVQANSVPVEGPLPGL